VESFSEVQKRAVAVAREALADPNNGDYIVLVAHGDVVKLILAQYMNTPIPCVPFLAIGNASISGMAFTGDSPPQILASLHALKIEPHDVKILLISHGHFDHDAGSAELIQATGAKYMVMDGDVNNVQSGGATDFAYATQRYPAAKVDRVLHDGDEVKLGGVTLTAHKTPGHTQGCTTWTLRSPVNGTPKDVVIVGSWNVNAGFRLVDKPGSPASYPGIAKDYQRTFAVLQSLKCDVFLGAHGEYFHMLEKLKKAQAGAGETAWIDSDGYKAAVEEKQRAFEAEWKKQ